jgi:carbon storage regulator
MLVLSRKLDQELIIAGCVQVRVLSIDGGRVRLGITAPRSMAVHRSEIAADVHLQADAADARAAMMPGWTEQEVRNACATIH